MADERLVSTKPRIRHTMLRVKDLDRSVKFYAEVLGMKEFRRSENEGGKYTVVFWVLAMKILIRQLNLPTTGARTMATSWGPVLDMSPLAIPIFMRSAKRLKHLVWMSPVRRDR